jgi:NADH:ubiquinone oxidoreductase subunit F (NADH-binding)
LELPSAQQLDLDEPTTVIVALIREVKTTLKNGIYYYKDFGVEEVVDLSALQCVVGRVQERGEWAIIDRSDNVNIQGD